MYNDGYLGTWRDYGTWAGEWKRERGCRLLDTFGDHPHGGKLAYVNMDWLNKNREKYADLFDAEKWNIVKDWYDCHLNCLRVSAPLKDEPQVGVPRRPIRFANAGMWNDGLKANASGKIEVH